MKKDSSLLPQGIGLAGAVAGWLAKGLWPGAAVGYIGGWLLGRVMR